MFLCSILSSHIKLDGSTKLFAADGQNNLFAADENLWEKKKINAKCNKEKKRQKCVQTSLTQYSVPPI
jgi:hypothetical protein